MYEVFKAEDVSLYTLSIMWNKRAKSKTMQEILHVMSATSFMYAVGCNEMKGFICAGAY